jgi:hypothetical protein
MHNEKERFSRTAAITAVFTLGCTIGVLYLPLFLLSGCLRTAPALPSPYPVGIVIVTSVRPIRRCNSLQSRALSP